VLSGVLVAHPAMKQQAASEILNNDKDLLRLVLRFIHYIDTEVGRFCISLFCATYKLCVSLPPSAPLRNHHLPDVLRQPDTLVLFT
jgi:hypothetical protein